MPKSRIKTRENRKKEALLNLMNEYGIKDPTPCQAVARLNKNRKGEKRV